MTTEFAARHSCDSPEWYTPSPFVEAAREVMGAIDLDPASHHEANLTVKAALFYSEQDDGLKQTWHGRVFLNPPGGKDANGKSLVPQFWDALIRMYLSGAVREAVWIGYSLEQLQTLQGGHANSPMTFPICVPNKRIAFVENEAKRELRMAKLRAEGKNPNGKSQPSHANYIVYLGGVNDDKFAAVFGRFGVVRL